MTRGRSHRWLACLAILSLLIGAATAGAPAMAMAGEAGAAVSMTDAAAKTPAPTGGSCAGGLPASCCVGSCAYCAHFAATMTAWTERDAPPAAGRGRRDRLDDRRGASVPPDPAPPRTFPIA